MPVVRSKIVARRMYSYRTQQRHAIQIAAMQQEAEVRFNGPEEDAQDAPSTHLIPPPSLIANARYTDKIKPGSGISMLVLVLLFMQHKIQEGLSDNGFQRFIKTHKLTWLRDVHDFPFTKWKMKQYLKPLLKTVRISNTAVISSLIQSEVVKRSNEWFNTVRRRTEQ
jgi:hypothetical protein